jgi:hypothetical protein
VNIDSIPIYLLFLGTILVVLISIEAGYKFGIVVHRKMQREKESPATAIAASTLSLLAFILAFTFQIVFSRYDNKKQLVYDEANAIGTAWLRCDFLPDSERNTATRLLRNYTDLRLMAARAPETQAPTALRESAKIQQQLWSIAVLNGRRDPNSHLGALFVESMNAVIDLHTLRLSVGLEDRIPAGIWLVLFELIILAMVSLGYQLALQDRAEHGL